MVGPCAVLGQPDAASCGALRDAMPRYAGTSNTTFVQLNVRAPSPRSGCCVEQDARRCFWHAALTSASFCQSCAVRWRVLIMAPSRQGPGRSYKKGMQNVCVCSHLALRPSCPYELICSARGANSVEAWP